MAACKTFTDTYNFTIEHGPETRRVCMEQDHPLQPVTFSKALKRSSSDAKLKSYLPSSRPPPAATGKHWQKPAEYNPVGAKRQMTIPGAYPKLAKEEPLYDRGPSSPFIPGNIKQFLHRFFTPSPLIRSFFSDDSARPGASPPRTSFTTYTRSGVGRRPSPRATPPSIVHGGIKKRSLHPNSTLASRVHSLKVKAAIEKRPCDVPAPALSPLKRKSSRDRIGCDACYLDCAVQFQFEKELEHEQFENQSEHEQAENQSEHEQAENQSEHEQSESESDHASPIMAPQGQWSLGSRKKSRPLGGKTNKFDESAVDLGSNERNQRFADVRKRLQQLVTPPPEAITDGSPKTTLGKKAVNTPKKGILRKPSSSGSDQSDGLATDMISVVHGLVEARADLTPSPTESTGSLDDVAKDVSSFAISPGKKQVLDQADREEKKKKEAARLLKEEEDRKQCEEELKKEEAARLLREEEARKQREEELKKEEAARRFREEEDRKQREEEFKKNAILKPLPEEWTDKVNSTVAGLEKDPNCKLPGTHVGLADIQKLLPSRYGGAGWLNDEVVNLYLNKVTTQVLEKEGWNKQAPKPVHAFGSQFWTSFAAGGHRAVASWTRRQKIQGAHFLSCRAAVIPICNGVHWTALVLSGTDRTIAYHDSMGGQGAEYVARARDWLAGELGDKYLPGEWRVLRTTPQLQNNSSDCGVFTCLNGHAALAGKVPSDAFRGGDVEAAGRLHVAAVLAGMPAVV